MNYLNVVMFSPEDLELVKGSPSARRKFIDSSVSQLYPRKKHPYKPNRLSQGVGSKKQLTQSSSCKRCKVGYAGFPYGMNSLPQRAKKSSNTAPILSS